MSNQNRGGYHSGRIKKSSVDVGMREKRKSDSFQLRFEAELRLYLFLIKRINALTN